MPYATFEQDRPYLTEKFRHPVFDPATGVENSGQRWRKAP